MCELLLDCLEDLGYPVDQFGIHSLKKGGTYTTLAVNQALLIVLLTDMYTLEIQRILMGVWDHIPKF